MAASHASRRAALVAALALLATGCGGEEGPAPEAQVRATLADFGRATAAKDYARLCTRILAPRPRGAGDCRPVVPRALRQGLE